MRRRPLLAVLVATLALATACSDDGSNSGADGSSSGATDPITGEPLGPSTTALANCAPMPAPEELAAIVGIPLDVGNLITLGTCEYRGLNDQSRVITLARLTDPGDQAAFNELVASTGTTTPLADATLAGAILGPDDTVFVVASDAIYTVRANVNDSPTAEQVPLSLAVLAMWLQP
ncbi:MAG: hypothetical protein Q7V57_14895 [Actinomycetota bacterium]|nr:hypothetical protein [Actinomycetota bacterium]